VKKVARRAGSMLGLFFDPEDGSFVLPFIGLHSVISQKVEQLMTTAVRTSYYTS
jgi:hypothetical protein